MKKRHVFAYGCIGTCFLILILLSAQTTAAPPQEQAPRSAVISRRSSRTEIAPNKATRSPATRNILSPMIMATPLSHNGNACLGKDDRGDGFGRAMAAGDFNGDGYLDLAVAAPDDDHGLPYQVGLVYVYRGTPDGLEPWQQLSQEGLGAHEGGDHFGHALAAGDVDGDGFADLAVGTPYEDLGSTQQAGYVFIFRGGNSGLTPWFGIDQTGLDINEENDKFGVAVAFGDFDHDGHADLAVGVANEDAFGVDFAGYIYVFRGASDGLTPWHKLHYRGIDTVTDNGFGQNLAVGDFDGDGRDDLAAGAPYTDNLAGAVYIFLSRPQPPELAPLVASVRQGTTVAFPNAYRLQAVAQLNRTGFANNAPESRLFGERLVAGDFNGDGKDDLAVGALAVNTSGATLSSRGPIFLFRSPSSPLFTTSFCIMDGQEVAWEAATASGNPSSPVSSGAYVNAGKQLVAWEAATTSGSSNAPFAHGTSVAVGEQLVAWDPAIGADNNDNLLLPWQVLNASGNRLAAGDLTGDGKDDMIVGEEDGELVLYLGATCELTDWTTLDPDGLFRGPVSTLTIADFDGDGAHDIAAGVQALGTPTGIRHVYTFRGHADGSTPTPWHGVSQQAPGCTPTWPAPPTIDVLETSDTHITIHIQGESSTTYLRSFGVSTDGQSAVSTQLHTGHEATRVISGLLAATEYCLYAKALGEASGAWSDTAKRCVMTTPAAPTEPEEQTFSVWLNRQPIGDTGFIPYLGSWGPVFGAHLTGISLPNHASEELWVQFVKPGFSTDDCDDPDAFVAIKDGESATPEQIEEIFGTSMPSGQVWFVACVAVSPPRNVNAVVINITYVSEE